MKSWQPLQPNLKTLQRPQHCRKIQNLNNNFNIFSPLRLSFSNKIQLITINKKRIIKFVSKRTLWCRCRNESEYFENRRGLGTQTFLEFFPSRWDPRWLNFIYDSNYIAAGEALWSPFKCMRWSAVLFLYFHLNLLPNLWVLVPGVWSLLWFK